jgi:beta-aspartyl-peptidase (threonine type)
MPGAGAAEFESILEHFFCVCVIAARMPSPPPTILIHGGAGAPSRALLTPSLEYEMRATLRKTLADAGALLAAGGSALDAVTLAVRALEDCPHLNAGRGAVFNAAGEHELDAAVQCGASGRAGCVAAARTIANPVLAARALLDAGGPVLLAGAGADAFARDVAGLAPVDNSHFSTPLRRAQLEAARAAGAVLLDGGATAAGARMGTVGAVALDAAGRLAAATSTGGMTNKAPGRVGDSPCLGAGTYADARVAVSCTGSGEAFLRACAAKEVACIVEYAGRSLPAAADAALARVAAQGGSGGLIALGANGEAALPFDTEGMYRGAWSAEGGARVAIYREELQ